MSTDIRTNIENIAYRLNSNKYWNLKQKLYKLANVIDIGECTTDTEISVMNTFNELANLSEIRIDVIEDNIALVDTHFNKGDTYVEVKKR